MGKLPTPETKPQDVKFFKIWELGFDAAKDRWANQLANDNNDTYSVQIPSDIEAGTYVLRTEWIALHGNMKNLNNGSLAGPQFYVHCFNLDVSGDGKIAPDGVNFPGAYKADDYGIAFQPFMTYGNEKGTEVDAKYVSLQLILLSLL